MSSLLWIAAFWAWNGVGIPACAYGKQPYVALVPSPVAKDFAGCRDQDRGSNSVLDQQLTDLGFAIEALPADGQVGPLRTRLEQLLEGPCFRDLTAVAPLPAFGSALALRHWWEDGGHSWFRSQLMNGAAPRTVSFPPEVRKVLVLDGNARHPLAPILCSSNDGRCGQETSGWLMRAEQVLAIAQKFTPQEKAGGAKGFCEVVEGNSPPERYRSWRQCVENRRPVWQFLPPLGSFRAPSNGWLIVEGRRGHHEYCDELSAYHLGSGSVFRARRCGDWQMGPPRTRAEAEARRTGIRPVIFDRGQVPTENLREAALMMFLWPEMQRDVRWDLNGLHLPEGVEVVPRTNELPVPQRPSKEYLASGDTSLAWAWVDDSERVVVSGEMVFAPDMRRPNGYSSWLLTIAEAGGLSAGCPKVSPSARVVTLGLRADHGSPGDQRPTARAELIDALLRGAALPCPPHP